MYLYIIRHAQSENNALWQRTGSYDGRIPDPGLTPVGHRQARQLAQFLADNRCQKDPRHIERFDWRLFELTHLYTSLMRRAIETGEYISRALNLPLVGQENIHERGGIWEWNEETGERMGLQGSNRVFFESHYPDLILPESIGEAGWWNRPYETEGQAAERAQQLLDDMLDLHSGSDDRVALVTHGGFTNALLSVIFGATKYGDFTDKPTGVWFGTNNGSISRLDFGPDYIMLAYLNRVDYLPVYLIT